MSEFRRDLPILMVRAGLDRPPVNRAIADLATLAANQNAPLTLLNYAGGHHAFEIVDNEDTTRDVIDTTIEFVKRTTAPAYQASLRRALPEATAAAHVASGNFAAAAASYAELVKAKPDDARMRLSYRRSAAWRIAVRRSLHRARETEGKGPRSSGSRRSGRARVHAERRCRSCACLAQVDPAAFSPAQSREGPNLCPDSKPPRVQGPVSDGRLTRLSHQRRYSPAKRHIQASQTNCQ